MNIFGCNCTVLCLIIIIAASGSCRVAQAQNRDNGRQEYIRAQEQYVQSIRFYEDARHTMKTSQTQNTIYDFVEYATIIFQKKASVARIWAATQNDMEEDLSEQLFMQNLNEMIGAATKVRFALKDTQGTTPIIQAIELLQSDVSIHKSTPYETVRNIWKQRQKSLRTDLADLEKAVRALSPSEQQAVIMQRITQHQKAQMILQQQTDRLSKDADMTDKQFIIMRTMLNDAQIELGQEPQALDVPLRGFYDELDITLQMIRDEASQ